MSAWYWMCHSMRAAYCWFATETGLQTWRALEDAVLDGTCVSIGVSNFTVAHLEHLLGWSELRVKPAVNQVEMHPYHPQVALRAFCSSNGIFVQAYASLGGQDTGASAWRDRVKAPPLLEHPVVTKAAKTHAVTPAAVLLRW